jgi:hypothetical protein
MITSFNRKFKTDMKILEKNFQHYGLRRIKSSLYVCNLNNDEVQEVCFQEKYSKLNLQKVF